MSENVDDATDTGKAEVEADQISVTNAFVKSAYCESLEMRESGAGVISASGSVSMEQSGAGIVVADQEAELFQAAAGVLVANKTDIKQGFVGVLASTELTMDDDTRVLITGRDALLFGLAAGVAMGVMDILARLMFGGRR